MKPTLTVHDLDFQLYLSKEEIAHRIALLGDQISLDCKGKKPLFIVILNGAFIFAADLIRACTIDAEVTFVRLSSYEGTSSSGHVKSIVGLKEDLKDRTVIIIEDIVDTGRTLFQLLPQLEKQAPESIKVAALLDKKEARIHEVPVTYSCFEITDKFVVGYGLDYNGLGRNLPDIYQLSK
jgi:hypoxanthine phosphoribosyltransferase